MKRYLLLLIQLMFVMSCNNDDSTDHVISPVEVDTTTSEILSSIDSACYNTGRMVMQSCRNCHLLFEDRTGPGLAGLEERKPDRRSLKDFIRNPGKTMYADEYYFCQKEKFGSVMTPFIHFTDQQLDCFLDYVKAESSRNPGRRSQWHKEAMANLKKSNGKSACP